MSKRTSFTTKNNQNSPCPQQTLPEHKQFSKYSQLCAITIQRHEYLHIFNKISSFSENQCLKYRQSLKYNQSLKYTHLLNDRQKLNVSINLAVKLASTAHRFREKIIEMVSRGTPDFISPLQWHPSSPYLKLVYYAIWGKLQERAHCVVTRIRDVDHLVLRLVHEWSGLTMRSSQLELKLLSCKLISVSVLNTF